MNSDGAFEILRYLPPIDRCRLRLINRSFNEAGLIWWRRTCRSIDIGRTISNANRRRRSKILSFLRFLCKYCTWNIQQLVNFSVDDQLLIDIVQEDESSDSTNSLRPLFNALESIEIKCLRMENYDALAKFLKLFDKSTALKELKLCGRYPMPVESWNYDEASLCASMVVLTELEVLHLSEMELKGDILACLNPSLTELVIDRCRDIDESNLITMLAWCLDLERIRLIDVKLSLETFRQLCRLPRLTSLHAEASDRFTSYVVISSDWIRSICENEAIEEVTLIGHVEDRFGDVLDASEWPIMINPVAIGDGINEWELEDVFGEDLFRIYMRNSKLEKCEDDA